jgi:hypothetical protein
VEDEILRQINDAREKLLARHGSVKAYIKHLRNLDRVYALEQKAKSDRVLPGRGRKKPDSNHLNLNGAPKRRSQIKAQRRKFDPILDPIRKVREQLLRDYGGFENYFKHLQKLDREYFAAKNSRKQNSKTKSKSKSARPAVRRARRSA